MSEEGVRPLPNDVTAFFVNAARRAGANSDDAHIHQLRTHDSQWGLAFFAESDGDQDYPESPDDNDHPVVYDVGAVTFCRMLGSG